MLGEELRVLYVAFTRAREKLILLGSGKKLEEKLSRTLSFSALSSAGTYLDWILPASVGSSFVLSRIQPELLLEETLTAQVSLEELWERLRHPEELPEGEEILWKFRRWKEIPFSELLAQVREAGRGHG